MGSANGEKVVIAGAGITGMTAALYLLEAGFDVTILEKSDHVGGKFGARKGRGGAVHEHAYHFLGDWCVNFWAVAEKIRLSRRDDFLQSTGVKFLRPRATGRPMRERLTTLRLDRLGTQFTESLYGGVIPPDDMMIWFYSFLELMAHGEDLDGKEFLNRISVNGFMRSLWYMTDLAALLHQEALMKAFSIPSYDTSARSYRRFARFFSRDQDGWILNKVVDERFWPTFKKALRNHRREDRATWDGPEWPIRYKTALEAIAVEGTPKRVSKIRVNSEGKVEWRDMANKHLLITLPHGDLASIVERSPTLFDAAPSLLELRKLKSKQMASLDLYFRRPLADVPSEHVTLIDDSPFTRARTDRREMLGGYGNRMASRFALSFVDNYQAWHPYEKDHKETWLNVVAADFEELAGLSKEEAYGEMLRELEKYLKFDRGDIDEVRSDLQLNTDLPLFMNTVGSWQYRPVPGLYREAERVMFENFYLAGDYCRSSADIVCLEGAVMTARMAACAIAEQAGYKGAVPEADAPAEVSDRKLDELKHELEPWLRLAARGRFGATALGGLVAQGLRRSDR
jgi:hypothetical protein